MKSSMRVSSNKKSKVKPLLALSAEEHITYQLADLGLQLHKLGRFEAYRQVIWARNELLAVLDDEFALQAKKGDVVRGGFPAAHDLALISYAPLKRSGLKVANHAR